MDLMSGGKAYDKLYLVWNKSEKSGDAYERGSARAFSVPALWTIGW